MVAVDPAAGLDVDRLPRFELLLEQVAVTVDPDDALVVAGEELVDEETAAVHDVGEPLDPAVVVLDAPGRGEELMLAHDDPLAGLKVQRRDVPGRIPAEGDLTSRLRLDQQQRHPAEHAPFQALLQWVQTDLQVGVLPQQDVMFEVDRDLTVQCHVQNRHELALEAVAQPWRGALSDRGGEDLRGGRHRSCSLQFRRGLPSGGDPRCSRLTRTVPRAAAAFQPAAPTDRLTARQGVVLASPTWPATAIIAVDVVRSTSPVIETPTPIRSPRRSDTPS